MFYPDVREEMFFSFLTGDSEMSGVGHLYGPLSMTGNYVDVDPGAPLAQI